MVGGPGSGRHFRWDSRDTVEGTLSVDVNWLRRRGMLAPGRRFSLAWTCNGEPSGSIGGEARVDALLFRYRCDGESVEQHTRIEWQAWQFGGRRPWFLCPAFGCARRCVKLYASGSYFVCRRCANLAYRSQQESWGNRALTKAQNIREKLGGSRSMCDPFPPRGCPVGC